MDIKYQKEETKKTLNELSTGTFCRTVREQAKFITGAKMPELSKLSPTIINNICGIASGTYNI